MTIVVVSIVAVPLSLLVFKQIDSVFGAEDFSIAQNLSRLEMEKVNNADYSNIVSQSFSNYEGYSFDLEKIVTYEYGDASSAESLKKIQIDVKRSGASSDLISLVTYLAKNVNYGI